MFTVVIAIESTRNLEVYGFGAVYFSLSVSVK